MAKQSTWVPILPVPDNAPAPPVAHHVRGTARRMFHYRDELGRALGYVCRFATSSGGATSIPLTWCESAENERAWRWMQFPELRPMFNLDQLAARPEASVLVVFDELSADCARTLMPGYAAVTWPGGIRKIQEVDWSPLKGRLVAIFPDHGGACFRVAKGDPGGGRFLPRDRQPNVRAAFAIADILRGFQATPYTIVDTGAPEALADGWNLADAMNAGWTAEQTGTWFAEHVSLPWAAKEAPAQTLASGEAWEAKLLRKDGHGPLLAELYNVRMILTHHAAWRDVIYLDEFAHKIMKRSAPPFDGGEAGEWTDVDDTLTHSWLVCECGMRKLRTSMIAETVQAVAAMNAVNPLTAYLRGLKWDGKKRLDKWLITYLDSGAKASPDDNLQELEQQDKRVRYLKLVGPMWLISAVARALTPGIKVDHVLILEGQQGLGKSSVLAIIGGEWAMDTPFSLSDKEGMEAIRGKWIIEMAELDSFNRAESTTAKTFFTRRQDRFRLPYGKRSQDFERSCVFAGTTNEHEYFRDASGNRRYWPVEFGSCNQAALERDRDQLLAEAVHRYLAGERFYPTQAEQDRYITPEQDRRQVDDPWLSTIARWLATDGAGEAIAMNRNRLTMLLVLSRALRIDAGRMDQHSMATRVGRCMRKLGYLKRECKALPERFYYEKGQSSDEGHK